MSKIVLQHFNFIKLPNKMWFDRMLFSHIPVADGKLAIIQCEESKHVRRYA